MIRYDVGVCALTCALLLAGCGSPESRIRESCIRDGGLNGNKDARSDTVAKQCICFAKNLQQSLTDEQLDKVAKLLKLPKEQREAATKDMSMTTLTAIMGAAKSCAGS
jgi:hypothetical protein